MKKLVHPVLVFPNLNVAVFDEKDQQIPELQKSLTSLYAEHMLKCGYDPEGAVIETPDAKWQMFRTEDGYWNRRSL